MSTLAKLLIEANINPFELPRDVEYIAQDKQSEIVFMYTAIPKLYGDNFMSTDEAHYVEVDNETIKIILHFVAQDWQTPLHIDTYKQAWEAAKMNNVEEENTIEESSAPEWPKTMQLIWEKPYLLVVKFESERGGVRLIDTEEPHLIDGVSECWVSCFDKDTWKPYVEAAQMPSVELLPSSEPMTAQEIVKRLEELKMSLNTVSKDIEELTVKRASINVEYLDLKEQLLTLI